MVATKGVFDRQRLETSGNKDSPFICSDVGNWPTTCCLKYWDGSGVKLLHFTNEADAKASTETRYGTRLFISAFPVLQAPFTNHLLWLCYLNEQYLRGEWDAGQPRCSSFSKLQTLMAVGLNPPGGIRRYQRRETKEEIELLEDLYNNRMELLDQHKILRR